MKGLPSAENIVDIGGLVLAFMKENGYDALCNDDGECCCVIGDAIAGTIFECEYVRPDCVFGHTEPVTERPCGCQEGDCDEHVVPGKRP